MGYFAEMKARDGVLWVYLPRVVDRDSMPANAELFGQMHAACEKNGCTGILIDVRGAEFRVDWPQKIPAALALAEAQVPGRRVAAIADPHNVSSDNRFQNLAGMAGALFSVFTDEEKALAWLAHAARRPPRA